MSLSHPHTHEHVDDKVPPLLVLYILVLESHTQMQLIYADQASVLECSLCPVCQPLRQQKLQINCGKGGLLDTIKENRIWGTLITARIECINKNVSLHICMLL